MSDAWSICYATLANTAPGSHRCFGTNTYPTGCGRCIVHLRNNTINTDSAWWDFYGGGDLATVTGCAAPSVWNSNTNACYTSPTCPSSVTTPTGNSCSALLPKAAGSSVCNNSTDGNPCDASTGNKFQTESDYQSNTLNFVRYYNSLHNVQSILGKQWTHHYLASISIGETIQVNRYDGKVLEFTNASGNWTSDADISETLTQVSSYWEFKTANDAIELYNNAGQLIKITTRDEKVTTYAYNTDGLLEQVTGPYGRTLGFVYNTSNRLKTLITPESTEVHYAYDANDNLISVIYPDNTPGNLSDNPNKTYHYENVSYPNHLTGITDENGIRYATYGYNADGLAILTEHANSAEKVELVYNSNETTTVTDALGRIKTYTFEPHFGLRKPIVIEYTYNDGQQLVTKNKTFTYYPDNGRIKEVTDYKGNITYYEYNKRGLVTLETQAKGKPEEYTVITTWHPDFRLPATRIYPDRTKTYSYDNKGLLINTQTTAVQ